MNKDAINFWLETRFRDALNNPEIIQNVLAIIKVGHDRGDKPEEIIQVALSDFVFTALGINILETN